MPINVTKQVEAGKAELKAVLTGGGMANGRATVFSDLLIEAMVPLYIKHKKEETRQAVIAKKAEYRAGTITLQQYNDWLEANRILEESTP